MKAIILLGLMAAPWRIEVDSVLVCEIKSPVCLQCAPGDLHVDTNNRIIKSQSGFIFANGFESEKQ
jgi:hypothetical protein